MHTFAVPTPQAGGRQLVSILPGCAAEVGAAGASAGQGAAPVGATAVGADAAPGTGAGAAAVEKVAADAVATAGAEGAVVAGVDWGTAGDS
jgi:hypothetical protein